MEQAISSGSGRGDVQCDSGTVPHFVPGRFVPGVSALFLATECAAVALPRNNGSPGARAHTHRFCSHRA